MRVLLSDGSGLTARQTAGLLAADGHTVGVLSPDRFCLTRWTRAVATVHPVPAFGRGPGAWLDAAAATYQRGRYDCLLPTQEQAALLAAVPGRLTAEGIVTVVPSFGALAAVQQKSAAYGTLHRLGIPQPTSAVGVDGWDRFPAYVKRAVGTASTAVRRVASVDGFTDAERADPTVLVQEEVTGPLVMCQLVFDRGRPVASHATLRTVEGANGGAAHKRSTDVPGIVGELGRLGTALEWHGALSADVVLGTAGPVVIDVNPRLVEPVNARRAGVDLVGPLLELSRGGRPTVQSSGRPDVDTHQLLLAVLGAAQRTGRRRAVVGELLGAASGTGTYRSSAEELTPIRGDLRAGVPVGVAVTLTLLRPSWYRLLTGSSVAGYALTAEAWDEIAGLAAAV